LSPGRRALCLPALQAGAKPELCFYIRRRLEPTPSGGGYGIPDCHVATLPMTIGGGQQDCRVAPLPATDGKGGRRVAMTAGGGSSSGYHEVQAVLQVYFRDSGINVQV
jgi:hypothetical protein